MSQWGSKISYKIDSNFKINISLFIRTNWVNSPGHHICTNWCKGYYMWWQLSKSSFFKLNPTLPEKLWLTEDNKHSLFLLYSSVEKYLQFVADRKEKELIFDNDGVRWVTKWTHIKQLYYFECERQVKLKWNFYCSKVNRKTTGFYLPQRVFWKNI